MITLYSGAFENVWNIDRLQATFSFLFFSTFKFFIDFIEIYNSFRYNQDNFLICWIRAMNEITERNNFNFLDLSNRRALLLSKMVRTLVCICLGAWDQVFGFINVNL